MKQQMKTTLYLPEELHANVKAEAARLRMSLTRFVVQALEHELCRVQGKAEGSDDEKTSD